MEEQLQKHNFVTQNNPFLGLRSLDADRKLTVLVRNDGC